MHRIDGAGHINHRFVAENPATNRPPTEVTPEILNALQEELATFIEWAGVVLDKGDNTQLRQALVAKFGGLDPLALDQAGAVAFFAMSTAPAGYLKANGATVSRTAYATLFAKIGTTFGVGDGSTTFTLPDLRGEFLRGFDDGRGADSGRSFGSAQKGTMNVFDDSSGGYGVYALKGDMNGSPNTNAGLDTVTAGYSASNYSGLSVGYAPPSPDSYSISTWLSYAALNIAGAGAGMTRPRNVALLACIKY